MFPSMKNTAGDALRQAFMSAEDYNGLREEEKAWRKLQRPLCMAAITVVWTIVVVASMVMVDVVFGVSGQDYPFCQKRRLTSFGMMAAAPAARGRDDDDTPSYAYTEDEVVQFFWFAVFLPSSVVFAFSTLYLLAGISVAYTAPQRHGCLRVVENNCCASRRGGVRCLSTLNISFLITYILLAIFLGSYVLSLGTSCAIALFWSYEVWCGGLVILTGATAYFLRRKAAVIMDAGEYYGHHAMGVELLEAIAITPEMMMDPELENRVTAGFKSWKGPADALSSDDDDDDDEERGSRLVNDTLDDVWEEDAHEYLHAPEDLSRSRIG